VLECLEQRRLLTAQISYANFSSTTGLVANGYGSADKTTGTALALTDGNDYEARGVFFGTRVPIDTFTTHFSFQSNADSNSADGFAFVIDNGTTADLGTDGGDLGYSDGTIGAKSAALGFNLYNFHSFGSTLALAEGGQITNNLTNASPDDFHSGDTFDATVTYDGTTLSATVTDANDPSDVAMFSQAVDLPTLLRGHSAYVGFTGATGSLASSQQINSWDYTGTSTFPTITVDASANPTPVTGKTSVLSVGADDNGNGANTYDWTVLASPSGAKTPLFSVNDSTSADSTTVTLRKDGTYRFRVTVTNGAGNSVFSNVSVVAIQTITELKLAPHAIQIHVGQQEQFTEITYDQFEHPMRTQPTPDWSVATNNGTVVASTGLFTAGTTPSHLIMDCSASGLFAILGGTVIK
jgi:hypothetical protein